MYGINRAMPSESVQIGSNQRWMAASSWWLDGFTHFYIPNIIILKSLSSIPKIIILTRLDAGQFPCSIASATGIHHATIFILHSKEHSELQKSVG